MAKTREWAFSPELQPRSDDFGFDLDAVLDSVVQLRAEAPEDAFTAGILGTERAGNGVVVRADGLVLTIGYLITEANAIWLTTQRGQVVAGHALAYDQATGFGLVQPLGRLDAAPLERGSAADSAVGDTVLLAGHGGVEHALKARVFDKREFAGSWEYVLDEAIFTAPVHPEWSGAGLIGADGKLIGIGSLYVQEQSGDKAVQGNMVVPIDILEPIFEDMVTLGRARRPPRAWLGLYATESDKHLVVSGVAEGGPSDKAGVQAGDLLIEVAGVRAAKLADFFRKLWSLGAAGVEVPLVVARSGDVLRIKVRSGDRQDYLRKPHLH